MVHQIVLWSLAVGVVFQLGAAGADLPPSAETVASDARGFGALKILLKSHAIRDELQMSETQTQSLEELWSSIEVEFAKKMKEVQRELRAAGRSVSGARDQTVKRLDPLIEEQLQKLLTSEVFLQYSRAVVARRMPSGSPLAVLLDPSIQDYLGLPANSTATLQAKLVDYLQSSGSLPTIYRQVLTDELESMPVEYRSRLVDLLGSDLLADQPPSGNRLPVIAGALRWNWIVLVCQQPETANRIFGEDRALRSRLEQLLTRLVRDRQARWRQEAMEAVQENRPQNVSGLAGEDDRQAEAGLREILNEGQMAIFSQFALSCLARADLPELLQLPEVTAYLGDAETTQRLKVAAIRAQQGTQKEITDYQQVLFESFVSTLDPATQQRLSNLVELD